MRAVVRQTPVLVHHQTLKVEQLSEVRADRTAVVKKKAFESRPTFRFSVGGDGRKLYLYGAGSSLEVWDADTLESRKLLFLNKDTTTNLVTIARR